MAKTTHSGKDWYTCGSYKRYGSTACSRHYVTRAVLEQIVLDDLNRIIASVTNLRELAAQEATKVKKAPRPTGEKERLETALARIRKMKQGVYEDYKENLLSRDEYLRYRKDYDDQEVTLMGQLKRLAELSDRDKLLEQPWVEELVKLGRLTTLDRPTIAETLKEIRIFEDGVIEITYLFSEELRVLLECDTDHNT